MRGKGLYQVIPVVLLDERLQRLRLVEQCLPKSVQSYQGRGYIPKRTDQSWTNQMREGGIYLQGGAIVDQSDEER
eukprot:719157-Pyramimonas_sp.AAC.1